MLKAQDLLLALKIQASGSDTFVAIGLALGMSASQAYAAVLRAQESGLLRADHSVRPRALLEALFSVRYYFPAKISGLGGGMPTAYAAPPLNSKIVDHGEPVPVWATVNGPARGLVCSPLYKSAPMAAMRDPVLYEYLALVDGLRIGRAREVSLAREELERRLLGAA